MKKQYKVTNRKKTPRLFTKVNDIGEYIDSIEKYGERVQFAWNGDNGIREMKYAETVSLIKCFSLGLTELFNGEKNKRIAVIGETSPYWVIAYLAILASGNTVVPMDKELDPAEISKFFTQADVCAVVYSATFNDVMRKIVQDHPTLKTVIPMESDIICQTSYDKILTLGKNSTREFIPDDDRERCCEILFTSGTTGTSKIVRLCQRNIFSVVNSACDVADFCADDVIVSVLPLHHTYELATTFLSGCNYGLKICINDSLKHVLKNLKQFRPTALVLVPLFVSTMYKKILSEAKRSGKDKILPVAARITRYLKFAGIDMSDKLFKDVREAFGGRLEKIICGGAELSTDMIAVFEAFGISIYEGYGITECSPLVAVTPYYKRKLGSVGPAAPCCEVRIDGSEIGESGFVTGEIQVRGDNVMLGYANAEANAEAFTSDGWFRTGDLGYMDNDGYIYITGRLKSVIVLENGKNVFPEEIEEYLLKIDRIGESVVVGRKEGDEIRLTAIIFPAYDRYPESGDADIKSEIQKQITALNKKLPSFKQIHKIEFRATEFEKTSSRKIKRHLVK